MANYAILCHLTADLANAMLPKSAVLDAYVQRVVSRPAFARAQALDDGG